MKPLIIAILFISLFGCKKQKDLTPKSEEETWFMDKNGVNLLINSRGVVAAAEFPDSVNISVEDFFIQYLNVSADDSFVKEVRKQRDPEYADDHYDQFYKDVEVDAAGYNFHLKNGKLWYANGNYPKIRGLDVTPRISANRAKDLFASHKRIPIGEVSDFTSELLVKETPAPGQRNSSIHLIYRVHLNSTNRANNEIGYLDAKTGKVLMTEPSLVSIQ